MAYAANQGLSAPPPPPPAIQYNNSQYPQGYNAATGAQPPYYAANNEKYYNNVPPYNPNVYGQPTPQTFGPYAVQYPQASAYASSAPQPYSYAQPYQQQHPYAANPGYPQVPVVHHSNSTKHNDNFANDCLKCCAIGSLAAICCYCLSALCNRVEN